MAKLTKEQEFDAIYDRVYEFVQDGLTIEKAVRKVGLDKKDFYKKMSHEQSVELSIIKTNEHRKSSRNLDYFNRKIKEYTY